MITVTHYWELYSFYAVVALGFGLSAFAITVSLRNKKRIDKLEKQ